MINEVKLPSGNTWLYSDTGMKYAKPNTVARTVKVLGETNDSFKITYPQLVGVSHAWVKKADIGYRNPTPKPPVKPPVTPPVNTGSIELKNGDTMIMSDKNGSVLGTWTFVKK